MAVKARGRHYFQWTGYPIAAVKVRIDRDASVSHPHDLTEREHDHDFWELVVVVRGAARHRLQGEDYPVQAGDVYVLRERSRHYFHAIESLELINIMVDLKRLPLPVEALREIPGYHALFVLEPQFRRRHQFSSRLQLTPIQLETARGWGEAMVRETQAERPGRGALLLARLLELMVFLSRQYGAHRTAGGRELLRVGGVIGALERDFARRWTVDAMAEMAGMSRSSFLRAFRRAQGVAPVAFLLERRLREAERLLRETDRSITEIALDAGFSDSNYLARQFRRRRGCSPSTWRSRQGGVSG